MDNLYLLIGIPTSILVIISIIGSFIGGIKKLPHAIVLGLISSLVVIVFIHPYHINNGKVVDEPGNLITALYIVICITFSMILGCYIICNDCNQQNYINTVNTVDYVPETSKNNFIQNPVKLYSDNRSNPYYKSKPRNIDIQPNLESPRNMDSTESDYERDNISFSYNTQNSV